MLVLLAWGCREAAWLAALWQEVWAPRWSDWSCWCWAWEGSPWESRNIMSADTAEHLPAQEQEVLSFSPGLVDVCPLAGGAGRG